MGPIIPIAKQIIVLNSFKLIIYKLKILRNNKKKKPESKQNKNQPKKKKKKENPSPPDSFSSFNAHIPLSTNLVSQYLTIQILKAKSTPFSIMLQLHCHACNFILEDYMYKIQEN